MQVNHQLGEAITEYRKAVELDRKAIELEPNKAEYPLDLGRALSETQQLDEAMTELGKAIQLDSDARCYARYNAACAAALTGSGKDEDAAKVDDVDELAGESRPLTGCGPTSHEGPQARTIPGQVGGRS